MARCTQQKDTRLTKHKESLSVCFFYEKEKGGSGKRIQTTLVSRNRSHIGVYSLDLYSLVWVNSVYSYPLTLSGGLAMEKPLKMI